MFADRTICNKCSCLSVHTKLRLSDVPLTHPPQCPLPDRMIYWLTNSREFRDESFTRDSKWSFNSLLLIVCKFNLIESLSCAGERRFHLAARSAGYPISSHVKPAPIKPDMLRKADTVEKKHFMSVILFVLWISNIRSLFSVYCLLLSNSPATTHRPLSFNKVAQLESPRKQHMNKEGRSENGRQESREANKFRSRWSIFEQSTKCGASPFALGSFPSFLSRHSPASLIIISVALNLFLASA